jgi:phytoene dehydrogenase-like protein
MERNQIVIVGGGLAGLTAAAYLARGGAKVTVYEKSASLGGRATTQQYDGFAFNRGIHALYTGGAASEVLAELNIAYSGHSPKDVRVLHNGKLSLAPVDALSLIRTDVLRWADKLELMRSFSAIPRLNPADFRTVSVRAWLESTFRRPLARQYMTSFAYTLVYSRALDLVSADVLIVKMQLAFKHPVQYLDGGWMTLVNGLREAAEQAGARIVSSARVESVVYENGLANGIRLRDGEFVPASAVVIAAAPHDALKLVNGGDYAPMRRIVDSLIPAQIASLDVALRRLPNPAGAVVLDMDGARFMSTQSRYARIAPEGGALLHVFKALDPTEHSDSHDDERDMEALLDTVQPGWRELVVKRFYLPRIDAIGMLPNVNSGGYAGRPRPEVPGIANLYLAGDWIGEGFLADASFGSARAVAQAILQANAAPARTIEPALSAV